MIEARLDKGRGPVATLLVQNGTLKQGDIVIAGTAVGRVRVMTNDKGRTVKTAGPSVPVEITGLADVPTPGDEFNAVTDERMARELVEQRRQAQKDALAKMNQKVTLDNLFAKMQEGEMKELPLIVKADVQGSAEALKSSLEKISNEEVRVRVIHAGVGAINESDILLASTAGAIVVGFNVRPDAAAAASAHRANVDMRFYRVIYDAIDEIEAAMKGMLAPKFEEVVIGHAEVRMTYKVSAIGTIAGCYGQGRQGHPGFPGACSAGQHRHPRGRDRLPAALQGRGQGSHRRLRVRHERREVQRHQGRRHLRVLCHAGSETLSYSPCRTGKLWINWQELTARDFSPDEGFQSGEILCVFPALETAQLGEKIRCSAADGLFRVSPSRRGENRYCTEGKPPMCC